MDDKTNESPTFNRDIAAAKNAGRKTVGYFCPYIPEELILSASMLPLRLPIHNRDGYPYEATDALLLASPCTIAQPEQAPGHNQIPVLTLEIPVVEDDYDITPKATALFKKSLKVLKNKLEKIAGRRISRHDMLAAKTLSSDIREKLRKLYEYPKMDSSPIEWRELFKITQNGMLCDRVMFNSELEELGKALDRKVLEGVPDDPRPRLMIAGANSLTSDGWLLNMVRELGGNIVTDALCTGSMLLRKRVPLYGFFENPLDSITEQYLYNVPAPCMGNLNRRLNYILKTVRDFRVHGLIYYAPSSCGDSQGEIKVIKERLYQELLVPTLVLEGDVAGNQLEPRINSFIDIIGGRV